MADRTKDKGSEPPLSEDPRMDALVEILKKQSPERQQALMNLLADAAEEVDEERRPTLQEMLQYALRTGWWDQWPPDKHDFVMAVLKEFYKDGPQEGQTDGQEDEQSGRGDTTRGS